MQSHDLGNEKKIQDFQNYIAVQGCCKAGAYLEKHSAHGCGHLGQDVSA